MGARIDAPQHRRVDRECLWGCHGASREARSAFGGEGGRLLNLTLDQRFRFSKAGGASDPARHHPFDGQVLTSKLSSFSLDSIYIYIYIYMASTVGGIESGDSADAYMCRGFSDGGTSTSARAVQSGLAQEIAMAHATRKGELVAPRRSYLAVGPIGDDVGGLAASCCA